MAWVTVVGSVKERSSRVEMKVNFLTSLRMLFLDLVVMGCVFLLMSGMVVVFGSAGKSTAGFVVEWLGEEGSEGL